MEPVLNDSPACLQLQFGHPHLLSRTAPPPPLKVRSRAGLEMPWDGDNAPPGEQVVRLSRGFVYMVPPPPIFNGHKCGDLIGKDEDFLGVFTIVQYRDLIPPEDAGA